MTTEIRNVLKAVFTMALLAGCTTKTEHFVATAQIECSTTADCSARGGSCVANACHADNECSSDADCASGTTCVADPDFGGLCTAAGQPPAPLPAWSCTTGKDCPLDQGCGSDLFCHVDGSCTLTVQADGTLAGVCPGDQICAAPGESLQGFCTEDRGGPNPYCRSTGTGECRYECTTSDDCGTGNNCVAGFCHESDECTTTADCDPNNTCGTPAGWENDGYLVCVPNADPVCVQVGDACRLPCANDGDCVDGGGCAADGYCHASNECTTDADCTGTDTCQPSSEFGGLCGQTGGR